jgi:hypothetical protein
MSNPLLIDENPRVTNTSDVVGEDERSALASKEWDTKECLQSSLKSPKNGGGRLGEEKRSSRYENKCILKCLEWPVKTWRRM